MIRLGLIDFDTSHAVEFTKRLIHIDIPEDQWVDGAKVVLGVPGTSKLNPEGIETYGAKLKEYGVPFVNEPAELIGKVDAVLIESVDGTVHKERTMPFLEKGIPTYVDKPFACSLADAKAMVETATTKHVPLMSSSSLRYAPEVVAAKDPKSPAGEIVGVTTFGPAPLDATGRNIGLFHYGIHPVEMLYTLMGTGCKRLSCIAGPDGEVVTGMWQGGRIGSVRGIRKGKADYGFTVFGAQQVVTQGVGTQFIYRELLKHIVAMFETGEMPIDLRETLEIVAFIEAAKASAEAGGASVDIKI